jgi:hypothetical protein
MHQTSQKGIDFDAISLITLSQNLDGRKMNEKLNTIYYESICKSYFICFEMFNHGRVSEGILFTVTNAFRNRGPWFLWWHLKAP